jgi:hypothetical protein
MKPDLGKCPEDREKGPFQNDPSRSIFPGKGKGWPRADGTPVEHDPRRCNPLLFHQIVPGGVGILADILCGGASLAEAISPVIQSVDPIPPGGDILEEKTQIPRIFGVAVKVEDRRGLGVFCGMGVERQFGAIPGGKGSDICVLFVGSCGGVEDKGIPKQKSPHQKGGIEPSCENPEK